MKAFQGSPSSLFVALTVALALVAGATSVRAQSAYPPGFPRIPIWSWAGAYCPSCGADSVVARARTTTVRFKRDRRAEARADFGGYRVYRVVSVPDSTRMMLVRRFSVNPGSELTWSFSRVDTSTLEFKFGNSVAGDSIVSFVDPDSNGNYVKVCRVRDEFDRCISRGDSVWILQAPPGPHDGFATYYAITYEARNGPDVGTYEDLYVRGALRDTSRNYANCGVPGDSTTCPYVNLMRKDLNVTGPVYPTGGPTVDLEQVRVVPNPYRAAEVWDAPGANEIHFINLPSRATIQIFTVSGDLVRRLEHNDLVHDYERWDLKNGKDKPIASGIYIYRVEAGSFAFQDRLVVIR